MLKCLSYPSKSIHLLGYDVNITIFEENESKDDESEDHDDKRLLIRISYHTSLQNKTQPEFVDEFTISHRNRAFLSDVVHTIYACFSKKAISNGFIKHNQSTNSFEFMFESEETTKSNLLSIILTCYIPKAKYTKDEAIQKIYNSNSKLLHQYNYEEEKKEKSYDQNNRENDIMSVQCINAHHIYEPHYELEITLNLSPGIYDFYVDDLSQSPTKICVRDYIRIGDYYMDKLGDFYQRYKVFRVYLDYIEGTKDKYFWVKMGFEANTMNNLYEILKQIKSDDDSIWSRLFDLCLMDVYETDDGDIITINTNESQENVATKLSMADFLTEQSIANFIALSIKYYCLDRKMLKDIDLSKELRDCDKYLLSIVLPYFNISRDDTIYNIPLITGLFNRYVNFYEDNKENRNNNDYDKTWKMTVDAAKLKSDLLLHLNRISGGPLNVVKSAWEFKQNKQSDKLEYSLIENLKYNYNDLNATKLLKCYDTTYEYEWAIWINKQLKSFHHRSSKGYWQILNEFDEHPRIPVKHLECMKSLITLIISNDYEYKVIDGVTMKIYDNINGKTDTMTAEYIINIWNINPSPISTTTLSIRIIKAFDSMIDRKKKIKSRDSHFLCFKPKGDGGVIQWKWYNGDMSKYEQYNNLGENVTKQIEATYQGVQEYNFPLNQYHRSVDNADDSDERLFFDAQLTELSNAMCSVF